MVLTQGQITEFFVTQMQLPAETVTKLAAPNGFEGVRQGGDGPH